MGAVSASAQYELPDKLEFAVQERYRATHPMVLRLQMSIVRNCPRRLAAKLEFAALPIPEKKIENLFVLYYNMVVVRQRCAMVIAGAFFGAQFRLTVY